MGEGVEPARPVDGQDLRGPRGYRSAASDLGAWGWWAVLGITGLFSFATARLGSRGVNTILAGLEPIEWTVLVTLTAALVYVEGVRALQRRWIPHAVRRAVRVRAEPLAHRLLAPLYAMSLLGAERRPALRAWAGLAAIVLAVVLVHRLSEPWKGIIDFAVAAALAWGIVAIAVHVRALDPAVADANTGRASQPLSG